MTTKLCPCGQEFVREARSQRYCNTCREARAVAAEALRVKVCRHCNQEKPTKCGICAECSAAKDQARWDATARKRQAKLERNGACIQCGEPVNHRVDDLCGVCEHKERRHHEKQRARQQLDEFDRKKAEAEAAKRAAAQDDDMTELVSALIWVLASFLGSRSKPSQPEAPAPGETPLPEWVDADDQQRVDATFSQLMEGFEL